MKPIIRTLPVLALLSMAACNVTYTDSSDQAANNQSNSAAPAPQAQQTPQQAQLAQVKAQAQSQFQDLHFLVDISERKLRLLQGDRQVAEHPVAVGSEEWPTPTGSWQIHQVDINPEWIPPQDESWAEDEERQAPGAPDNPLGRARLVYRMPNTIHGTEDVASLGKAQSHGSIRVANDVVLQLAQTLLQAGGAWEGPEWFRAMTENRTREFQIRLDHPVPIEVRE